MKILVAIPAVSKSILKHHYLEYFVDSGPFLPTGRTLDVFSDELKGVEIPGLLGINVPHWSFDLRGGYGVSGPGSGKLWHPESVQEVLADMAGVYDKWRPYPAQSPLSRYNVDMARRFARKRSRMFVRAAEDMKWDTIFYVEHSSASIAHLDERRATAIALKVVKATTEVASSMPFVDVVVFSPYGIGRKDGFVVSNRIVASELGLWPKIRRYLEAK